MKFGHIGIKVTDIEKSKKFYTEVLDCKIIKDYKYPTSNLVFLDAHGTIIELIYKNENTVREIGPVEHIAFKVDSLDEKKWKCLKRRALKYKVNRALLVQHELFSLMVQTMSDLNLLKDIMDKR